MLDTVLVFSLLALMSYSDANKHNSIVKYINWVSSQRSVGVHKTLNHIGRTYVSLL